MFIPLQNTNSFPVFYMGGDPALERPGKYNLELRKDCVRLQMPLKSKKFGISIPYNQISDVSVSYDVQNKNVSLGKAVAGDILAGPIGAIAGGAMGGGKKVESFLVVSSKDGGTAHKFVLSTKQAEKIQKKLNKRL